MFSKLSILLFSGLGLFFLQPGWDFQKSGTYKACEVDINGNVYVIDQEYNFMVFKNQDTFRRISLANLGNDPIVDASNPLEVFVFFPNTGKVLWYDNQLNQQSFIDIFRSGITQAAAFGRANDGNIWVMDNNNRTLKKINREGDLVVESIWISAYLSNGEALRIYDNGEFVLVPDGYGKVFVFDQNLQLQKATEHKGFLLGISSKTMYSKKGSLLLGTDIEPRSPGRSDTLFQAPDSLNFCAVNKGFILLRGASGIFLQKNEK